MLETSPYCEHLHVELASSHWVHNIPAYVECSPLLQGQPCYEPDNVIAHAN